MNIVGDWEIIKLSLEQAEKESDRYWIRMNIFVTLLGAMFAIIVIFSKQIAIFPLILFSIFGLSISLMWLQVARVSKFYAERWRSDARELLSKNKDISDRLSALTAPRVRRPRPYKLSSSFCMKILAIISAILWAGLLFYAICLYIDS